MNNLSSFSTKQLFVEIFSRMLKEQHPEWDEGDIVSIASDGYDSSDDEIEELYRRIDEMGMDSMEEFCDECGYNECECEEEEF